MKNIMSMIGTGVLMAGAGYGVYSFVTNNQNMMKKKLKKATKIASPYTANSAK